MISAKNLTFQYESGFQLGPISFDTKPGTLTLLYGKNGSGKSTLLKLLCQELSSSYGEINFAGQSSNQITPNDWSKLVSLVPQTEQITEGFTVFESVMLGRLPWQNSLKNSDEDIQIVTESLRQTSLSDHANTLITSLSGGQFQRMLIARCLAQKTQIILMDEPSSNIDGETKKTMQDLIIEFKLQEKTVIIATHDKNWLTEYAAQILILENGKIASEEKASH